jgi:hypothetical protein
MRIKYKDIKFQPTAMAVIDAANKILREYASKGIVVTLRQLYYQFVARGYIVNDQKMYKKLGVIISDARLAGLIDWDYLQDRTRNLQSIRHWNTPADAVQSIAQLYHRNLWADQEWYIEVWVEKDALLSVIEGICEKWDVPFFACRGYNSQSEMQVAGGKRFVEQIQKGKKVRIIHLGDHDPSGVDMTKDIRSRMLGFIMHHCPNLPADGFAVKRYALNMKQIEKYQPPPNPAKMADPRAKRYIAEHGNSSWELDALDPEVLTKTIQRAISKYVELEKWNAALARQENERKVLVNITKKWKLVEQLVA